MYFGIKFYAEDPCKLKEEITRYSIDLAFEQYMYGIYKRLYLKSGVNHLDACLPAFCIASPARVKFKPALREADQCLMIDVYEQWYAPG